MLTKGDILLIGLASPDLLSLVTRASIRLFMSVREVHVIIPRFYECDISLVHSSDTVTGRNIVHLR